MIKRRSKKQVGAEPMLEEIPYVVESPVTGEQEQPEQETTNDETPAKPKKKRYAPVSTLNDRSAVILSVVPNPKRVGSESHRLYDEFYANAIGKSIAEFEQAFKDANRTAHRARRFLRWSLEHGEITLGKLETAAE